MKETNGINKEKNFISIVTYIRNNEKSVERFLLEMDQFLYNKFLSYEFVFVNDNSNDNSLEIIKKLADKVHGNVIVVNLAWQHKIELAMLAGDDIAIGDFIFEFDSPIMDFDINKIWEVYNTCLSGYDIVAASPNKPLKFSSKLFYRFLNKISYRNMELTTETFRILSRRALNRILTSKEKTRYRKALYHYSGFDTTIVNYEPISKAGIKNEISFSEKTRVGSDVLICNSDIGTKAAGLLSTLFFILSIIAGGFAIISYITVENIEPGWTTLMLFMSAAFTGMFLILAILAKYMVTLLSEVQDRPSYIFRSVDRLSKK